MLTTFTHLITYFRIKVLYVRLGSKSLFELIFNFKAHLVLHKWISSILKSEEKKIQAK